jgi:glycosyltransferase involved in cell wall biosynthesis
MRLAIVSHAAIKASNRRVYRELGARGHDVRLFVPDRWKSGLGPLRAQPEPADSPLRMEVFSRVGISHSNVYCLRSLARAMRDFEPDAIYVDEDPAGLMAAQGARIAQQHDAGLVVLAIQNLKKRYPPPFEALQRYVFERTKVAVTISARAGEVLRERGFTGQTIPMPFSTDLAPLSDERRAQVRAAAGLGTPLAGYAGRLVGEKGIDVFLHALALAPDIFGAIVGDGPERAALEALAATLGIADRVRFLGVRTPDETAELIGSFDVLALPSRTRANWAEQFGRVLIEAMACGVPVVASDSGAIGEVVSDAGILVPEDDAEALAAGLRAALDDRARLGVLGRERVAHNYTRSVETSALERALATSVEIGAMKRPDRVPNVPTKIRRSA